MRSKPKVVLVIEDSQEDFNTLAWIANKTDANPKLLHALTGEHALEVIAGLGFEDESEKKILPELILLDLNLPGVDGLGVLQQFKSNDEFKHIPIVVITTSSDPKNVLHCYQSRANSYIVKPVDLPKFQETISLILSYWLDTVVLPAFHIPKKPVA